SMVSESLGATRKTFFDELLHSIEHERARLWTEQVEKVNWELHDRGSMAFNAYAMEELVKAASKAGLIKGASHEAQSEKLAAEVTKSQLAQDFDKAAFEPFNALRVDLDKEFASSVFFWPRQTGPKGDLVDDEMSRVLQVPGWSNIFTQPIINRIEMLATGVR